MTAFDNTCALDCSGALWLVFMLHGMLLRLLSKASGMHYAGLAQGARDLRRKGRISNNVAKKLVILDQTLALLRHLTSIYCQTFFEQVAAELAGGAKAESVVEELVENQPDAASQDDEGATATLSKREAAQTATAVLSKDGEGASVGPEKDETESTAIEVPAELKPEAKTSAKKTPSESVTAPGTGSMARDDKVFRYVPMFLNNKRVLVPEGGDTYRADNSMLKSSAPVLGYRKTANVDDKDGTTGIPWGDRVSGSLVVSDGDSFGINTWVKFLVPNVR